MLKLQLMLRAKVRARVMLRRLLMARRWVIQMQMVSNWLTVKLKVMGKRLEILMPKD